jgi:hypothetical protein
MAESMAQGQMTKVVGPEFGTKTPRVSARNTGQPFFRAVSTCQQAYVAKNTIVNCGPMVNLGPAAESISRIFARVTILNRHCHAGPEEVVFLRRRYCCKPISSDFEQ